MIINIVVISMIAISTLGNKIKITSEVTSQNFTQENIPIAKHNISTIRYQSSKKHEPFNHEHERKDDMKVPYSPKKYLEIQYAPLPGKFEKSAGARPTSQIVAVNVENTENTARETLTKYEIKTNIAPYVDIQSHNYRSFVPGYNVEVLQLANRKSEHNQVHRNYPEILGIDKRYKIINMEENIENPIPEPLFTQSKLNYEKAITDVQPVLHELKLKNVIYNHQAIEKLDRLKTPLFAKLHRIHLNLARVYSPGQAIPKLPIHKHDFSIKIRPLNYNPVYPEVFDKKTQQLEAVANRD